MTILSRVAIILMSILETGLALIPGVDEYEIVK